MISQHLVCTLVCLYLGSECKCSSHAGPNDVSVQWHVNGRRLETSVMEHRHALSHDAVLVSSWIKERPLDKPVQYECKAGNDVSKIDLWPNSMGKIFRT